ncbi:hypothetical protein X777_12991 [Ooceraea biroi]|uniref:Uncharacterized protein n=1 Tax=Ooceraea biroi TaxID=2015173 RepID=A0A026VYF9_OOCBI|nr:hypothetical protein X777_12991 [Ooceraea biroi]
MHQGVSFVLCKNEERNPLYVLGLRKDKKDSMRENMTRVTEAEGRRGRRRPSLGPPTPSTSPSYGKPPQRIISVSRRSAHGGS